MCRPQRAASPRSTRQRLVSGPARHQVSIACSLAAFHSLQIRAADHPEENRLPRIYDICEELQELVWDCTKHNRRNR